MKSLTSVLCPICVWEDEQGKFWVSTGPEEPRAELLQDDLDALIPVLMHVRSKLADRGRFPMPVDRDFTRVVPGRIFTTFTRGSETPVSLCLESSNDLDGMPAVPLSKSELRQLVYMLTAYLYRLEGKA